MVKTEVRETAELGVPGMRNKRLKLATRQPSFTDKKGDRAPGIQPVLAGWPASIECPSPVEHEQGTIVLLHSTFNTADCNKLKL